VGRFVLLVGAIFAITAGVVVTQRLSDDALALLLGLACGVLVMIPTAGIGLLLWRRESARQQRPPRPETTGSPPVIVVTPSALPGYGAQRPALGQSGQGEHSDGAWTMAPRRERNFTIVGGEK
jgi:uncharacterized SAM-binding protein YcdF (DUF218 family)